MAKFTCTKHGDQANDLVLYWRRQTKREIKAKEWFMAALALGSALGFAPGLLAYVSHLATRTPPSL